MLLMNKTNSNSVISINELWGFYNLSESLFAIIDCEGLIKMVSPSFSNILGFTENEMLGKSCISFVHPEDQDKTLHELLALANGHLTVSFVIRLRTTAKNIFKWISWTASMRRVWTIPLSLATTSRIFFPRGT